MVPLSKGDTDVLLAEDHNGSIMDLDGKPYVVTKLSCTGAGWILADLAPRAQVQAGLYHLIRTLAAIIAVCTVLMVSTSYLVTISITKPLEQLCAAMEHVEIDAENLSYQDSSQDEVGTLGKAFDRMLKRSQELVHCVYQIQLEKKEESLLRKQAELDALQMQINPHFLYNTLDIIRWQMLSEEHGGGRASTMLMEFSQMLKLSTRRISSTVPLSEELEHIKAYLRVMEFDREYPLELKLDIPNHMLAIQLPKLSLQPLVENAIIHGKAGSLGPSMIQIRGEEDEKEYRLSVENEGAPIKAGKLEKINLQLRDYQSGKHIGLSNVNERLRLQLGGGTQLRLTQSSNGLTQAVVSVPKVMPLE